MVVEWLQRRAPGLGDWLSGLLHEHLAPLLAATVWLAAALALYALVLAGRRGIGACRELFTRIRISAIAFRNYARNGVLGRLRAIFAARADPGIAHEEIELSDLDLAVLKLGASLPPGLAISVIDLAQKLGQRPSQVEQSLIRLRRHQLVDPLLGSTDGFDDYRLTDSGAWFISTQLRQQRDAVPPGGV